MLAAQGWCGVTTALQAKEALLEEVAIRSVGKSDLGLLLSSVDHTAFRLYGTMPDLFKTLHGEEMIENITDRLVVEEFHKTLVRDPRWAEMRKRWVLLGWRGASEEDFDMAFVRAAADRVVEIHDRQGDDPGDFAIQDTVLDERIQRARPAMRQQMMDAFAKRLTREWEVILTKRAERVAGMNDGTTGQCPFCGNRISVRWGDPPVDPGNLVHSLPTCVQYDTMTADEFVRAVVDGKHKTQASLATIDGFIRDVADRGRDLDAERDAEVSAMRDAMSYDERRAEAIVSIHREHPGLKVTALPQGTITEPFTDHGLMRHGRVLWEMSYAVGMSDEDLRDTIGPLNKGSFADEIVFFAAKWAVHAFQRLVTSHTFAAALMCSDVQKEVLVDIQKQWDAFMVIVPNGMLVSDGFEFSRILVATYSFGARMILLTTGGPTISTRMTGTITDDAPTLSDLLASDGSDLAEDAVSRRCLIMAKRLVAGLLLNLQHEPNFKVKKVEARERKKGREAEPEHRIVTVGKPLEIDCRDSVKEYIEHGKAGRKHGPPTVQVMVRGHFRRQVCGVGRMDRKVIWIEPFWRGPEAALIQTRAKVST